MFLGQIFEMEILLDLHVLRSPESENHIFSVWPVCIVSLCVSMCVPVSLSLSLCVCVSVISITQKQITAETSNLVLYICIMYRGTQKNSYILRPMDGFSC